MDQIFKTKIIRKMDQPLCSPSPFSVDDVKYFISRKTSKYDIRLVNDWKIFIQLSLKRYFNAHAI